MVPVNTGKENGHVTTGASGFNRLRRRSEVVIVALVVAGLCVLALGAVRAQAQAPQTAPSSIGSQPDERAYQVSMNRLRDLNEVAAPSFSVAPDARAYERAMDHLRDVNEVAAPSIGSSGDVRAYERRMQRLLELNSMDAPSSAGLLPARDTGQRTGPF
ncbi:MAG: hypothetical protein U0822_11790 [Anaerolineae bacterium]